MKLRRLIFNKLWFVLAGLICLNSLSRAQPAPADLTLGPGSRAITYIIALTDRLRVSVFQEDDLSTISRVDSKGRVNLPLVGPVMVSGLTIERAQEVIQQAYQDGRFLRAPQITITVEEYAAREVIVQGEVVSPGRIPLPIESGMTVLDAITKAGGFTDMARGTSVSVKRTMQDGTEKVWQVDVKNSLIGKESTTDTKSSMLLLPDDIVYVPIKFF